jgi:four helix bundle protein
VATAKRFEDLEVWCDARELIGLVCRLSGAGAWAQDFALRDQVRRASISILSNIAECFERGVREDRRASTLNLPLSTLNL